eukprot:jgi/Tetstr1/442405/TSEL_030531.t1
MMTTRVFITKNVDAAAEIHDISLQHYGESTFNKAISGNLKIPSPAEAASSISAACNEGLPDCEGKALDEHVTLQHELVEEWQETSNDAIPRAST